ncbi:hypothetical protein [Paraburkholderia bannensis]|uniref:hypothetical protein n=1 Tax=Paraburkholderia bannensis TaxID=765414 RepID=UPI0012EC59CB|nr:hypothetical protein [Paraburkholderia bannensis]
MESIFDRASWEKYLKGFTIYDCAIVRQHGFCLVLVEQKENRDILPRTRFLTVIYDKPITVGSLPMVEAGSFSYTTIASGLNPPEYVAVDMGNLVYSANAKWKGVEKDIDKVTDMSAPRGGNIVILKVVRVAGQIYALGTYRKIYRRLGQDQWTEMKSEGHAVPLPDDIKNGEYTTSSFGFKDMCGFNEHDMYAVGGEGDVWRFDGKQWHYCPFPTNTILETVACGEDGKVYISDMKGCVWAGRENRWTQVAEADFGWGSQPLDSAWFKGRLYLGSQDGLYTLGENKNVVALENVDSEAPGMGNCGRVDVSPDGQFLLTAGSFGATLYDGTTWTRLFSGYDFM